MLANSRLQTIICTTRLEFAEPFYRNTLGLPLKSESDGSLVFDVNGSDLRLSPVPTASPSQHTVIGFSVSDIFAVIKDLRNKGITFERFNGFNHDEDGIVTTPTGSRVIWLRDPDGNLLSVVQF